MADSHTPVFSPGLVQNDLKKRAMDFIAKESIKTKTKLQAASKIFNEKLSKLDAQAREDLRLSDTTYMPGPDMGNPLHRKAQKKIVAKKSLEDDLKSLLGDKAEAAMLKLLGGGHIKPDAK